MAAAAQLPQLRLYSVGNVQRSRSKVHAQAELTPRPCKQCCWASRQSLFLSGATGGLRLTPAPIQTPKPATNKGQCRALADTNAVAGALAGLSSMAPLAFIEGEHLARGAVAASVSAWYLTAKPGALQGLLDIVAAPASERLFKSFEPTAVRVGKQLGEGSFGVVYKGFIKDPTIRGDGPGVPVVLKKVKAKVSGAEEMRASELYFNQRLQRTAPGSCAEFLGTINVEKSTQKRRLSSKLSEGLWLVWRYQGASSLEWFLRRRDALPLLAGAVLGDSAMQVRNSPEDLLQRDCAVVQAVMRNLLDSLQAIHATGVVHRDVKPLNLVLDEEMRSFKLIDLGACVDLRSGYNFVPDETIMDPVYCAPEQYVLPISMPDAPPGPLMSLLAPLLFLAHAPDKFDLFSAGLVLVQLAVPSLRSDRNLALFNEQLADTGFDLDLWRASSLTFPEAELQILDANDGAAWDLARLLLQPREGLRCRRPTAEAALGHRFLTASLQWQTEKRSGSAKGRSKSMRRAGKSNTRELEPAFAPTGAFRFALPFGIGSDAEEESEPEEEEAPRRRRPLIPFFGRLRNDAGDEAQEVENGGASFDRKVKLKAAPQGAQSAVTWSALLPLGRRLGASAEPQPATAAAETGSDRLLGLRRLVGLDSPSTGVPVVQIQKNEGEEFPHVAALAALLGQTALAGPAAAAGEGLAPWRDTQELVDLGRASAQGLASNAGPMAAAGGVLAGVGWLGLTFVNSSVESGIWSVSDLADALGAAGLLGVVYRYVLKPGLTASPVALRPAVPAAPPSPAQPSLPLYARMQKKVGSILERAGLNRAGGMTLSYTKWLVKQAKQGGGNKKGGQSSRGLVRSLREMEQQLANLEAAARDGQEFDPRQKELLARVEALLQETAGQGRQGGR
ncbi:hypothetical protein KFL_000280490 [Klebsormidium nitens]|uniref:Protein kinase domain-containing protein n=1 Tax=Klebsormidium nitens TaxID=105231 RepID=A0A1Y1HL54_KLENI|nr:hypothetical protein KFL_000280490 [Klebsormidium nitens]|eukprot:GAQ79344.1 hypothetical protein KFL_000280490 [Klebsormidium nitens]